MQAIYLIDYKGNFRGSFHNIRDAKNHAHHQHINNYFLKKVDLKGGKYDK